MSTAARIKLEEKTADAAQKAKGELELGIRPKYLEVTSGPVENGLEAIVKKIEDLGSYKIVTMLLNDKTLYARLPEDSPVTAGKCWIVFPHQNIKLYADGRLVK